MKTVLLSVACVMSVMLTSCSSDRVGPADPMGKISLEVSPLKANEVGLLYVEYSILPEPLKDCLLESGDGSVKGSIDVLFLARTKDGDMELDVPGRSTIGRRNAFRSLILVPSIRDKGQERVLRGTIEVDGSILRPEVAGKMGDQIVMRIAICGFVSSNGNIVPEQTFREVVLWPKPKLSE